MVCSLIVLTIVALKSLMFKVCRIIAISKVAFFEVFGTERVTKHKNVISRIKHVYRNYSV